VLTAAKRVIHQVTGDKPVAKPKPKTATRKPAAAKPAPKPTAEPAARKPVAKSTPEA